MDSKEQRDEAEGDLIDLVRLNDAQNFTLKITIKNGTWRIVTIDHDARQTEPRSDMLIGTGSTFTEAWRAQAPTWATGEGE